MNNVDFKPFFEDKDYDIRKSGNARFMDQKLAPDVLSTVAECIIDFMQTSGQSIFTINDIKNSTYANHLVITVYNKPEISNAQKEYDKFFSQPIKMLAYSGVLHEDNNKKPYKYSIVNEEILNYIASRDRNAYLFLAYYLGKVIFDSGLDLLFDTFFKIQDKESFRRLKDDYTSYILEYTPINTDIEVHRIFPKILNPLSCNYCKKGTDGGFLSKKTITFNDLLYNRVNWRDIRKEKSQTRLEFNELYKLETGHDELFYEYNIGKAKKVVKNLHSYSEIHRFSNYPATQAHHIFLVSEFPEIAYYPENIIAITPNQHFFHAHPENKTRVVDKTYQMICLLAKLDTIENDYMCNEGLNYSKNDFIEVLNIGLNSNFELTISFEDLKHEIVKAFAS